MSKNDLYDFVEKMQARYLDRKVYLIENNARAYAKTSRLLERKRERRDITKID